MEKIDAIIGKSIRHYRWLQGVSHTDLAAALGISEAQLRSHEAGKSRVSAARLLAISGHLGVDVTAFFQRNPDTPRPTSRPEATPLRGVGDSIQNGKYLAALMTHFQRLNDSQKQAVLHLVVSISKEDQANTLVGTAQKNVNLPVNATFGKADRNGDGANQKDLKHNFAQTFGMGGRDGPY